MEDVVFQRMKSALRSVGVTQKDMSTRLGIDEDSMSNYIRGKRPMPLEKFFALCVETQCSPLWILFGAGDKKLPDVGRSRDEQIAELALQLASLATSQDNSDN